MRVKKKRKFQRGGGSSQTPLEWKFRVDGGLKQKNLPWGGMDIFWNCTIWNVCIVSVHFQREYSMR